MKGNTGDSLTPLGRLRVISQSRISIRLLTVSLWILVSGAIVAPFYYSKPAGSRKGDIRFTHDLTTHLSVMEEFDVVLRSGAIYPRWLPHANHGYGAAWPNFYQPGFYFLTSLTNALTKNWTQTLFAITGLALAASGLSFYVMARVIYGRMASAIAALMYTLLPYHLLDFFWRGAMPEFLSFALLPLILYFFLRLGTNGKARFYAGLGLCYGSLLMIHIPIWYLFSYVLVVYSLAWTAAEKDWKIAGRQALGMALGLLLSGIYWIPAVAESKYASQNVTKLFPYQDNYIAQLPGVQGYDQILKNALTVQSIELLAVIAVWFLLGWRSTEEKITFGSAERLPSSWHTLLWMTIGLLAILMNLPFSYHVARLIPKIEVVAFPSRWLVIVCFFASLLTAATIERLANKTGQTPNRRWSYGVSVGATIAVIGLNIWFSAQFIIIGSLSNPMGKPETDFLTDSYVPKGAAPARLLPITERIVIESKSARSELLRWEPLYRQAVITTEEATTARFRTFNFPGWTAQIDGAYTQLSSDPVGAQLITVPPGAHTIEIRFASTPARNLGTTSSVAGVFIVWGLILTDLLRGKRRSAARSEQGGREDFQFLTPDHAAKERTPSESLEVSGRTVIIKRVGYICIPAIVLAAVILFVTFLNKQLHIPDEQGDLASTMSRTVLREGADAKLSAGASNVLMVAVDDRSLNEVIDAISRKDDQKMKRLLQSGKAFNVEQGVKVRLLGLVGGKVMVKIMEGSNASKVGWVIEGWLK